MDKSSATAIRKEAQIYFQPFLLGNNKDSRRLSRKIFKKYGITSYVLDEKRSIANLSLFSHRFIKLLPTNEPSILALQLLELLAQTENVLPILVPCSKEYENFIERCKTVLETDFVLSTPNEVFTSSPLKIIP